MSEPIQATTLRFRNDEIKEWMDRVVPKPGSSYFSKNDDLEWKCALLLLNTGSDPCTLASFPGRLFAMIDFLEWNKTYGFLASEKILAPFPTDPEVRIIRNGNPSVLLDSYVYGKMGPNDEKHWGDLHYPIATKHAGDYDLIVFSQTLEHLYNPLICLQNLNAALKPGGFLFTSVPMLNHLHMGYTFFTMPTPYGLAMWMVQSGFEVLKIGHYGSEQYMHNLAKHNTWWPRWKAYFNKTRRPQIINDARRPVQTWVLARK